MARITKACKECQPVAVSIFYNSSGSAVSKYSNTWWKAGMFKHIIFMQEIKRAE
jgi:hypothetical protein